METITETFPSPNEYVDRAMELLSAEEYKVLSFAVRHILGWQDKREAWQGTISYDMLEKGYTTRDGKRYGGTGLARNVLKKVLDNLNDFGLLVRVRRIADGQIYMLSRTPDWSKMETRKAAQVEANRQRTATGRKIRAEKKQPEPVLEVSATNFARSQVEHASDYEKVSQTNYQKLVPLTGESSSDYLNQSNSQNHTQSHKDFAPSGAKDTPQSSVPKPKRKKRAVREPSEWQQIVGFCKDTWGVENGIATQFALMLTGKAKSGLWKASNLEQPATLRELKGWYRWIYKSHRELPRAAAQIQQSYMNFRRNMAYEDAIRDANDPPPPAPENIIDLPPMEVRQRWIEEKKRMVAELAAQKQIGGIRVSSAV